MDKMTDRISKEKIAAHLKTKEFGQEIHFYDRIDSTQDAAKSLAERGVQEGALVIAEQQIQGRGRMGRHWSSGKGGLWFSLLLRPKIPPTRIPILSRIASQSVSDALRTHLGIHCKIKKPNDVVVHGEGNIYQKVSGILIETSIQSNQLIWVILGCGINVYNRIPSNLKRQAIRLRDIVDIPLDRNRILAEVLLQLETNYRNWGQRPK
ncbi:MAG: biotin--[acetyl-CoA-carboxylase] ligase [Elusimicrobia bacterium]|nr:biotin--[acetyl-CoA-carboxylase] ligase [Elusimicrobiota bacterium]